MRFGRAGGADGADISAVGGSASPHKFELIVAEMIGKAVVGNAAIDSRRRALWPDKIELIVAEKLAKSVVRGAAKNGMIC